jgi:hypothetical protein
MSSRSMYKRKSFPDVELDNYHLQKRYLSERMAEELSMLTISPRNTRENSMQQEKSNANHGNTWFR